MLGETYHVLKSSLDFIPGTGSLQMCAVLQGSGGGPPV